MAQTKRKRRRKHRGTQGGKIDTRPRSRPRSRAEAKQRAQAARRSGGGGRKRQAAERSGPKPATWMGAIRKSLLISAIFFGLLVLLLKEPMGASLGLVAFMLAFYVPMSYYIDRYMYARAQRKEQAARAARSQNGADPEA